MVFVPLLKEKKSNLTSCSRGGQGCLLCIKRSQEGKFNVKL